MQIAPLPHRAVLAVSGADRVSFLNGLVSNDVAEAAPGRAVWAALLTPQGKWLADFFIFATPERLLLDVEAAQAPMIAQRLTRFRLRASVAIESTPMRVFAAWGPGAPPASVCIAADPRLPEAGWRILVEALPTNATPEQWDAHRLALGLPEGTCDLEAEKTVLLEAGFDELHGVSWTKGCYMGQELTARTRYRGLIKRRLVPVLGDADLPPRGTAIEANGTQAGEMRSSRGKCGLAVLRLEAFPAPLSAAGVALRAAPPRWLRLPAA